MRVQLAWWCEVFSPLAISCSKGSCLCRGCLLIPGETNSVLFLFVGAPPPQTEACEVFRFFCCSYTRKTGREQDARGGCVMLLSNVYLVPLSFQHFYTVPRMRTQNGAVWNTTGFTLSFIIRISLLLIDESQSMDVTISSVAIYLICRKTNTTIFFFLLFLIVSGRVTR